MYFSTFGYVTFPGHWESNDHSTIETRD